MFNELQLLFMNMFINVVSAFIDWTPPQTFLGIRFYSLCWVIGLALAYIIVHRLYKDQKLKEEDFEPLFYRNTGRCTSGTLLLL